MPAPTAVAIQNFLTQALLNKGFVNKSFVDGRLVVDATKLPDKLADLVSALSNGMAQERAAWQAAQGVVAVDTVTSAPVVGTGPAALP